MRYLVSTVASVWAALLIGLILFQHQTQETERKKKEELDELLKTELGEVRRVIKTARTVVPDAALETTENHFTSHEMQYVFKQLYKAARKPAIATQKRAVCIAPAQTSPHPRTAGTVVA